MGYGLVNGFIDRLYTPLGTTSNYSADNLKITTAPAKAFAAYWVFTSHCLATASNSGGSSASRAHVVTFRRTTRN
jgi:hypothetical protein